MLRIGLLSLAALLAGCTAEQTAPPMLGAASAPSVGTLAGPAVRRGMIGPLGLAKLPDRGAMVVYAAAKPRVDGAYTWHRVEVSEAHALAAVDNGRLALSAPDGARLEFAYLRHVEHPSGDWTWVGRAGGTGDEIVVTFGERAVFGTISQPGQEPLRLTSVGGVTWVVETDRTVIADIDNHATRPRQPDFLLPPKAAAASAMPKVAGSDRTSAAAPTTAATHTVDLVLGYTAGFASAQGGASQAMTRLNYLVEVTNQAYANSQVDARVRLVHAMQVDYADSTSNSTALEELTGFRAPSTRTTPNPVFAALRSARDTYGADLVSLVRKFSEPENGGCGIAWLLGGEQSGIDPTDEYFGYSVVGDGSDAGSDGKTYFCRDETLAHELGHNMGSQHDRATATVDGKLKYGVSPYAFGYKTDATAGNFYTVMAYGESGQTRYRTFSNPRSTFCGGRACGIADQADNARSLGETIPKIGQFRETRVADTVRNPDVNGDGKSELLFRNAGAGLVAYWLMDGPGFAGASTTSAPSGYELASSGDFNNDNRLDLVWLRPSDRQLLLWSGNGGGFVAAPIGGFGPGWTLAGRGDVNADGNTDLFFRNAASGTLAYWLMSGPVFMSAANFGAPAGYEVALTGDFNGDRRVDVLWKRPSDRHLLLYSGNTAGGFNIGTIGGYGPDWSLVGRGDVNGDGKADLLFRNPGSGWFAYWIMDGATFVSASAIPSPPGFELEVIGDYDADGRVDLVWVRASDRQLLMWVGNGSGFAASPVGGFASGWAVSNVAN